MKRASGKSNLDIVKDYLEGSRPFIQTGYTSDLIERKEGEEWEDSHGKKWRYENGRKVGINNIKSKVLDMIQQRCSMCDKNMDLFGDRLDEKIFKKTGKCFDCNVEFETKLKTYGLYGTYEKIKIFNNQKGYCLDMKQKLEETVKYLKTADNKLNYLNEDGSEEKWSDTMREKLLEDANKDLKECRSALRRINKQLKDLNADEFIKKINEQYGKK